MIPVKNDSARPEGSKANAGKIGVAGFALALLAFVTVPAQPIPNNVTFRNYFGSMTFNRPVLFLQYPGQDSSHIVLQQNGRILTVQWIGNAWVKTDSASITVAGGDNTGYYEERGLLGFAFHPDYNANRKYYIYYFTGTTAQTRMVTLAERTADITLRPKTADTQRILLTVTQPENNHNGGTIGFGPDGYLYFALGDGGPGNDPDNRAQNKALWYGKMLRINVDSISAGKQYAVPADNPFRDSAGALPEIWAYGFRNPWKWTFHPLTGQLWAGDVGEVTREEISIVPKGGNMGWKIWEGNSCRGGTSMCNATPGVAPVLSIPYGTAGRSITGGTFFMGQASSAYFGVYIFGDYISNRVWAMRVSGGVMTDTLQIGTVNNVVSFDRDSRGRVFATSVGAGSNNVSLNTGVIYVLESPDMVVPVSLRDRRAAAGPVLRLSDIRMSPGRYELRDLEGKVLVGVPAGAFWVRERGKPGSARLMTGLR